MKPQVPADPTNLLRLNKEKPTLEVEDKDNEILLLRATLRRAGLAINLGWLRGPIQAHCGEGGYIYVSSGS